VIKYLGSKRVLIPRLVAEIAELRDVRSVLDLFSGTSRVGHALKRAGHHVIANDHNAYAHVLARCYVEADAERTRAHAERLIAELERTPGCPGWFTDT
jgi:adenine-specific DNA-methyltransferase